MNEGRASKPEAHNSSRRFTARYAVNELPSSVLAGKQGGIADLFVPCMFVHTRDFYVKKMVAFVEKNSLLYESYHHP